MISIELILLLCVGLLCVALVALPFLAGVQDVTYGDVTCL